MGVWSVHRNVCLPECLIAAPSLIMVTCVYNVPHNRFFSCRNFSSEEFSCPWAFFPVVKGCGRFSLRIKSYLPRIRAIVVFCLATMGFLSPNLIMPIFKSQWLLSFCFGILWWLFSILWILCLVYLLVCHLSNIVPHFAVLYRYHKGWFLGRDKWSNSRIAKLLMTFLMHVLPACLAICVVPVVFE